MKPLAVLLILMRFNGVKLVWIFLVINLWYLYVNAVSVMNKIARRMVVFCLNFCLNYEINDFYDHYEIMLQFVKGLFVV